MKTQRILSWSRDHKGFILNRPIKDSINTITTFSGDGFRYINRKIGKELHIRLRKLTNKECFMLMGLKSEEADKILACGITAKEMYRLAGNSIVVDVLVEILLHILFYNNCTVDKTGQFFIDF